MGLKKHLKDVLQKCDFFCSTQYLRYKKQPEYRTIMGGFFSIFLIFSLLIVFSNKVINTLNMMSITSTTSFQVFDDPTPITLSTKGKERRSFMFGVQIWHHNLNQGIRYFDINLMNMEFFYGDASNGSIEHRLQPCTLDHWRGYPLIQAKFEDLKMDYWVCPPKDIDFDIRGKYSSEISRTIEITANKCTNNSNYQQRCADDAQLNQFFADFQDKVFFTIYFVNPRINPEKAEFLTYYLEDQNYIIFSKTGGQQAQLIVDDFSIQTDDSISPFPKILVEEGSIIQRTAIKNRFQISADNTNYCTFFLYKSPNSLQIQRAYQKLDEILSYIGGLFGTLALCLFLVRIYNGYSFQIHLGGILYKHNQEKDGFKRYNFYYFLTQALYNLLKLFGCGKSMEKAKGYQRCRTQLLKQLDVLYLLKRVSYLQRAIQVILDDHQLKGIHLLKKLTLDQARSYRKKFRLHQQTVQMGQSIQYNRKDTQTTASPKHNPNPPLKKNSVDNQDVFQMTAQDIPPLRTTERQALQKEDQSQSSSSEDEGQAERTSNTLEQLLRLKAQKEQSRINQRIYNNLSDCIKKIIQVYQQKCRNPLENSYEKIQIASTIRFIDFKPKRRYDSNTRNEELALTQLLKPVEQKEAAVSNNEDQFSYVSNND